MTSSTPTRRRSRGSAWYWQQTDSWYYTPPGTKRRVRLYDEDGRPVRGEENRKIAELALARIKVSGNWRPAVETVLAEPWVVARICSLYIDHCQQRAAVGAITKGHRDDVFRYLNDLCGYCGVLPLSELRKGHVQHWIESHATWRSPVTHRDVITIVLAAFNYAEETYDVPNPLRGLKKPPPRPRLHSLSLEDEQSLYLATDEPFRDFLFAAIHTGLRPYCELAKLTTQDVIESERGMLWRVYSSKTKKSRKIPVRWEVAQLTRRLIATGRRDSAIFLNARGRPWKKVTGVTRFSTLKKTMGWDRDPIRKSYSTYSCRHTFAHRMLAGYWNEGVGCSIEVLAELMGDTPKVAFDHYGKEWGQHYQEPLWKAIGVD